MMNLGRKIWVIPEGYIPDYSNGPAPEMTSHETACILNTGDVAALIELTIFFEDSEPFGPYIINVAARRTLHMRFNDLASPHILPTNTNYSSVFISNVPVIIQHSRLDSRQAENALLSTIAYFE